MRSRSLGLALAALAIVLSACSRRREPEVRAPAAPPSAAAAPPSAARPDSGASLAPGVLAEPDAGHLRARRLMVPVEGVRPRDIRNSFLAPRGTRTHDALDILAARGTPVLSADDGRVLRLRSNRAGGLTIYAVDSEDRFVYYYAHLDRYREGLTEGTKVSKGELLGYVGSTGNARPTEPHLHFQVMRLGDERRWWDGRPVDPTPYLVLEGKRR